MHSTARSLCIEYLLLLLMTRVSTYLCLRLLICVYVYVINELTTSPFGHQILHSIDLVNIAYAYTYLHIYSYT